MKKWDEMTARERDALVAEKVMGLSVYRHNENIPFVKSGKMLYDPSPYTTDISAAWEVFEELRSKGRYLDICTFADFYEIFDGEESLAELPSLPEAICLAALRALEVEV